MLVHGDMRYQMIRRLKLAKRRLIWWNNLEVGDIFKRIERVKENIAELQRKGSGGGSPES